MATDEETRRRDDEARRKDDEARRKAFEETQRKGLEKRAKAREDTVKEYYEHSKNAKPTPTPEEIDRAVLGVGDLDKKEDDGSDWDDEYQKRAMEGRLPGNNPYDTRDLSRDTGATREPQRGSAQQQPAPQPPRREQK